MDELFRRLLAAAVLAPTPDNNQPWRFVRRGERLDVHLDPARALPSDVNSMFDLMGVGAALENACIAARESGYDGRVERPADADGPRPAASLALVPEGRPDRLHANLASRCTNRKLYSRRPVPAETLAALAGEIAAFPTLRLEWIADRPGLRAFARVVALSDRFRFQYQPFHEEIFRQLRFSAAEAERTRDGLDLRTLELPPGTGLVLRALRPWRRMAWIHRLRLTGMLTAPSALSVWKSGALGVLSLDAPAHEAFVTGGRAFQRIWLAADAAGVALQPLGSLPIFIAQMEQIGGRNLTAAHRALSTRLAQRLRELVPSTQGRTLLMLFRLGYAPSPRVRSLRLPLDALLAPA